MKKFLLLFVLIFVIGFSTACDETDTDGGGDDVVADRILAVAEFDGNDETIKVGGVAGAVPPGSEVDVTNLDTGETKSTIGLPDGSFDPEFQASLPGQVFQAGGQMAATLPTFAIPVIGTAAGSAA